MDEEKAAFEKEYMMLREEIMHNQKQRDSIAQFAYTITVAMFAAGLSADNSWVVLCVLPFLIPMSLKVAECGYSIAFLSTYLSIYLEPNLDFNWETNHLQYYKTNKRVRMDRVLYMCARLDFAFLALITGILFWHMRRYNFCLNGHLILGLFLVVFQLLIVLIEGYLGIKYSNIVKLKDDKLVKWDLVKKIKSKKMQN